MNEIELIQKIGNEICEGCGPDRDCDMELEDCDRISNAVKILKNFISHTNGCGCGLCNGVG